MPEKLFVSTKDESPDMFETPWVNYFSRVHPITPVIIYLPAICWFLYDSIWPQGNSLLTIAGLILAGLFGWSFFEYALHRWVFHYHPTGKLARRIHWLSHGVHHDYPQDHWRLVMPPAISMPLAGMAIVVCYFAFGRQLMSPFIVGFMSGYLIYDMLHYASHHFKSGNPVFLAIKKHHMKHHYQDPDIGFGFTSKLWDKVFGTDFKD